MTELDVARQLHQVATQLIGADGIEALYEQVLDAAMAILHSDFASIQMFYPERGANGALRLLGHRGFSERAAKHWEWVDSSTKTTCGEALRTGQRVAVADVRRCDFMADSEDLEGYLAGNILAVQSTPLVSRSAALVGMISTHWLEPHELSETEVQALDILARQAADLIERSRAEGKLRRSEELLRSSQRLAHVGSWEWNIQTNQVSWSDEEFEVFGVPRHYKPSYEKFFDAVIPEEREQLARELRDALAEKRGFSSQVKIMRPNGELRTISFIADLRLDNNGGPVSMFGATQDITDVKRIEAILIQDRESLRALSSRFVDLQESGMKELAYELHDDLGQKLAALGMEVSSLLHPSSKRTQSFSERVRALHLRIKEMADNIHSIATRLHPVILEDLGLKAALDEQCRSFSEQTKIPVRFEFQGESKLSSSDLSLCFYRVVQEGLHNITKHARATKVSVTFYSDGETCTLRIKDNGQGFDQSRVPSNAALGLISMQERARLVNANFRIKSELGKGTTVELSVGSQQTPAPKIAKSSRKANGAKRHA